MFASYGNCKHAVHQLTTVKVEHDKKVRSLEFEIIALLNQIQELKAVNNYQTWELEKKIVELESQLQQPKIETEINQESQ